MDHQSPLYHFGPDLEGSGQEISGENIYTCQPVTGSHVRCHEVFENVSPPQRALNEPKKDEINQKIQLEDNGNKLVSMRGQKSATEIEAEFMTYP